MKYTLIIAAMIIATASLTFGQTCEQTAKDLEVKVGRITQEFDKAGYEQMTADDAVIINTNGEIESKAKQSESFVRSPNLTAISFSSKDLKIRSCGETTIVITGKDVLTAKIKSSKENIGQAWWFTRIYEKRRGRWQLIYNQLTNIEE